MKFSVTGDSVKLQVKTDLDHSEVLIRVEDTGKGIPQEMLPDIFEPFVREDHFFSRDGAEYNVGIGLGLAIVKGITEMHGGSVSAESDGSRKGSTFTIRLPLSAGRPL